MPSNLFRRGKTWYARYVVAGELQRISLRTGDIRKAKERLTGIRAKAQNEAFGVQSGTTWNDAVIAYSQGVLESGSVKESTAKRYRVSLWQLDPHFNGKTLAKVTASEISNYVDIRQQAGATNSTIRRDLTTLSRVLAFARSKGAVTANAADAYDRTMIRERRAAINAPSDADVAAALAALDEAGEHQLAAIFRLLRATGMRAGEAIRARWEDLDGGQLVIHETKNGRARTIAVPPDALPKKAARGRIFPSVGADSGALASLWQWRRRDLPEGQRFRIHDLRHAYAIAEIRRERDIYDLSHHLGHSSVKVTEIYLGYVAGGRTTSRR
jgi:integrase/recombinase XerD